MPGRRPLAWLAALLVIALAGELVATTSARGGDDGKTPLWQLVEKIAEKRGFAKELAALVDHQEKLAAASAVTLRPRSRVKEMLARPWRVPVVARELRDGLNAPILGKSAKGSGELEPLVALAARFLDVDDAPLADLDEGWEAVLAAVRAPHELPTTIRQLDLRGPVVDERRVLVGFPADETVEVLES